MLERMNAVPPQLFACWEQQTVAAERSRMLAQLATERRVREARARVERALRTLEIVARVEYAAMT